jgi:hypothetical protein
MENPDQASLKFSTRAPETDMFESTTSCTAGEHSSKELFEQHIHSDSLQYLTGGFLDFLWTLFNTASSAAPQVPLCRRILGSILKNTTFLYAAA